MIWEWLKGFSIKVRKVLNPVSQYVYFSVFSRSLCQLKSLSPTVVMLPIATAEVPQKHDLSFEPHTS